MFLHFEEEASKLTNVLVTGATGFIGRNLCRALEQEGTSSVVVLLRDGSDSSVLPASAKIIHYRNSISDLSFDICSHQVDGIIHLGSLFLAEHQPEDIDRLIDANLTLGTKLLEAAARANVKWFINTSSFWQHYNNQSYSPTALYAATKEAFECILRYYAETSLIRFVTLELFDTYGSGDTRPKLFNLLRRTAMSGELLAMSPGQQRLNLVHIQDVVEAYRQMVALIANPCVPLSAKYSVAARESVSLRSVVELFARLANCNLNIQWGAREYRAREIMDPKPIYDTVPGWTPCYSLEEGIRELLIADGLMHGGE